MRLIDSNELKEWVNNWFEKHRYYHPHSKANDIPITELYDLLEQMPTVDAVLVVRCGECFQRDKKTGWCDAVQDYISNTNWFCAGGVRKDGADE